MEKVDLLQTLRNNIYPGRGIILARSYDDKRAIMGYFIMGRSENSRNRIFVTTDDGIKTQAHDEAKMADPSLVIYNPVRRLQLNGGVMHIVTNGDQTDTIYDFLLDGKSYLDALMTRTYEPDAPNNTPRISGMIFPTGAYMLSILKTLGAYADCCQRQFYHYDRPEAGSGHFLHTYIGDGDPLPSFEGEPSFVNIPQGDGTAICEAIWEALNADNKVSLYICEINIETGNVDFEMIKNKNSGD
ncbi:MAG: IMP cyclohydrolase [Oscillospiraceae bacterium]|nr:IMP cyclohydrolase [Oscillospiraceae bacterium]